MKPLLSILAGTLALGSLACHKLLEMRANTQPVFKSATQTAQLEFPGPWLDPPESLYSVRYIEVRKIPNSTDGEFLFASVPDVDFHYKLNPRYGKHKFAARFSDGLQVRTATDKEWESGSRVNSESRRLLPNTNDDSSGQLEYRRKSYSKAGQMWRASLLSPHGKWLAIFSCSGIKTPPDMLFGGNDIPVGDVFWEIYDTSTGTKLFQWEAKNVRNPTRFESPTLWLEERFFLFSTDVQSRAFNVVTLPSFKPEVNPVTLQLPPRKDAAGQPLPPGELDEVWIPLIPLTKEQAAKLTARSETEITDVRWTRDELLIAINEETENRPVNRQQRDGGGDYHLRVISTYYYAISLENPTQTRVASKEEFKRVRSRRSGRSKNEVNPTGDTVTGELVPHRQFPKTGETWGSPAVLNAGEWIAVFSYTENGPQSEMFIDIYEQRQGDKLMSTSFTFAGSPNQLFKHAVWSEGDYILFPLNAAFDSFALWQLPGGM